MIRTHKKPIQRHSLESFGFNRNRIQDIFSHIKMFSALSEHEGLIMLSEKSEIIVVDEDEILMKEGESGNSAFIMLNGNIEVLKKSFSGDDFVVATTQVNESSDEYPLIGEQSFISQGLRTATIRTVTTSSFMVVRNDVFEKVVALYPEIGLHMYKQICKILQQRLSIANSNAVSLFQEYISFMSEDLMETD